jgi:hypothetical protein
MALSRRKFFALAGASTAGALAMSPLEALYVRLASGQSINAYGYGPLVPDPKRLLDLPAGFQYRAFSRTGETMSDGNPVPPLHDGMAAFQGPNSTTILVRNHEVGVGSSAEFGTKAYDPRAAGGTTTLILNPRCELISHYQSLAGTIRNCAGGPTPWGSWISCEETDLTPTLNPLLTQRHGYTFDVPSSLQGLVDPVPLKAMGRFTHEAIAVDPATGIVYETEDQGDSLFYRFIPNVPGQLVEGGVLEALVIKGQPSVNTKDNFPLNTKFEVEWVRIDDPDPVEDTVRVEGFSKGAAQFSRGEGIWFGQGELYFCCTNGGANDVGQVWRYIPGETAADGGYIELFLEPRGGETKVNGEPIIDNPDNIVVTPFGDLFLCEDGDATNSLVGVTPEGNLYEFARNRLSEFAGACFSPSGRTLFVNIQVPGITFAIRGPWLKRQNLGLKTNLVS